MKTIVKLEEFDLRELAAKAYHVPLDNVISMLEEDPDTGEMLFSIDITLDTKVSTLDNTEIEIRKGEKE